MIVLSIFAFTNKVKNIQKIINKKIKGKDSNKKSEKDKFLQEA